MKKRLLIALVIGFAFTPSAYAALTNSPYSYNTGCDQNGMYFNASSGQSEHCPSADNSDTPFQGGSKTVQPELQSAAAIDVKCPLASTANEADKNLGTSAIGGTPSGGGGFSAGIAGK